MCYVKKHLNLIIVGLLALIFFVTTSSFNYLTQDKNYVKWSSPDEAANYFFTKKFSQAGELAFFDRANLVGDNLVMPRSVRSDFGWIKPVSFLGIILIYGSLAAVFGAAVIPFLTPFFAALGLIFFYLIIRRLFNKRVALWSAFLLAVFPVYVYYTVRSMFHNVLFIVLLLTGVYLFILALGTKREKYPAPAGERELSQGSEPESGWKAKTGPRPFLTWNLPRRQWWEFLAAFGAGLFNGLAVITRTSELLWLIPVWLLIWLFYARRLGLTKLLLFLAGLFLPLIPVAYYNQILYGSFWHGGYNEMNRSLDDLARSSGELLKSTWQGRFSYYRHYVGTIFKNVFYFGFKYEQSVVMFRHYVLEMFPVLFYGGLGGLLILIIQNCRHFRKKYLVYVLSGLILAALLIFYYGSWKFNDNPDPAHFTIGNSYTRYWLPIYLILISLISLALVRLSRTISLMFVKASERIKRLLSFGLQSAAAVVLAGVAMIFVLYGSEEGLAYLYYNNRAERAGVEQVWSLTEPAAVIITRYYDKFLWPERRVIMATIPEVEIFTAVTKLIKYYPVYYYNFYWNKADVNYLNERKLAAYGLEMKLIKKINDKFGLYKLEAKLHENKSE